MRIAELHIENFRGVRCVTLQCGAITALVGRNGTGKSTFLHALDLFYKPTAAVSVEDFSHRRTEGALIVRVTFEGLQANELDAFAAYVHGGRLVITKRFQPPGQGGTSVGQYHAARRRYARFTPIRGLAAKQKRSAVVDLAKDLRQEGLIGEVSPIKSEADADAFMNSFEAAHPDLLELQEDTFQFFGEKNVGGGKLDNYTQFVYVPAVRDAQQETGGKGTSFSQLLDLAVLRRVSAMPQVAGLLAQLKKIVTDTFEPEEVRGGLKTLEGDINAVLRPFVPTASLSLEWSGDPEVRYEPPKVVPSLTEDAFSGEISRKGHGLQRALIFALLSHLARIRTVRAEVDVATPPKEVTDLSLPAVTPAGQRGPDYIIGIEEPELYQHPNRCRHFASVLRRLATEPGADDSLTQILLTTHSPYFVSLEHFDEVRLVRKDATNSDGTKCTSLSAHSVDSFRAAWADICGRDPKDVTLPSLLARLLRTMTSLVNEGFFADIVVLVEGSGDAGAFSTIAELRGADWVARGVTVLPVDGKENLAAPLLIFRALGIPTYYVFDGDRHLKGKESEPQTTRANRALLRLGGVAFSDSFDGFPDDTVAERFACFSGRLEDSCRDALGADIYAALTAKVAAEIGWPVGDILKSSRGAQRFVEEAHDAGKHLLCLERIVEKITSFAESANLHASPSAPQEPVMK